MSQRVGEVLAYLKYGKNCDGNSSDPELDHQVTSLIEEYSAQGNNHSTPEIDVLINKIPAAGCYSEKAFLEDQVQIIVAVMNIPEKEKLYEALIKHLNRCYACFKIYCDIMRDYNITLNKLNSKSE